MRVFPANGTEWSDVALAPFKTYPIVVFLIAAVWSSGIRGEPIILYLILGYLLCLIVVTLAAAVDTFVVRSATTNRRWCAAIATIGVMLTLKCLPTLAQ